MWKSGFWLVFESFFPFGAIKRMLSGLEAEEGVSGALVSMIVINWDYAAAVVASSVEKIFPFESTRRDFWMMSRNGFPINYNPLPVV